MDLRFPAESYSTTTCFLSPTFNARRAWPVSGDIVSGDRISDYTDYLFGVPYMVQRELEKNMIREEIMAEMARRQALEDEVWREIRMKKELSAVPMVYHHQRRPYDGVVNGGFTARVVDELPFQRHPAAAMAEFDSPPQTAKGRLLLLPKPSDAEMPSPAHAAKEELSCALCQVTASSEHTLNDHLRGKKHKAKAAMLKAKHHGTKSKRGKQQRRRRRSHQQRRQER